MGQVYHGQTLPIRVRPYQSGSDLTDQGQTLSIRVRLYRSGSDLTHQGQTLPMSSGVCPNGSGISGLLPASRRRSAVLKYSRVMGLFSREVPSQDTASFLNFQSPAATLYSGVTCSDGKITRR